ncbi:cupin domain-containing protein [Jiella pelagia]|uniref:Cupin domain-containing protein n=1 Tax=Jiella pelagia TaxID=2986949 RepID=A0ABY7C696_9HYPH|nr:hypothetical protein [Jiella pelagia]WAP71382.1 hypothetical protein OH818_04265 [Jiella pelagia]
MADRPVVKLSDLDLKPQTHGETFAAHFAPVAAPLGAKRLGSRYVEIPAGKKGWPFHCHHANDEPLRHPERPRHPAFRRANIFGRHR